MMFTEKLLQQSSKLLKQAPDGLSAHLYEHIIASRVENQLFESGYLSVLDYDIWGYSRSRTCSIDTRFRTKQAEIAFIKAFDHIDEPIDAEQCRKAAEECACEYIRTCEIIEDTLLEHINCIAKLPWESGQTYDIDIEDNSTSVNRSFVTAGIRYSRQAPQSFINIVVGYVVPWTFFAKNSHLKPLGMVVIEALAMNQARHITNGYRCYNAGLFWQEGVQRLAYGNRYKFKKDDRPTLQALADTLKSGLRPLKERDFTAKLHRLLTDGYSSGQEPYFSDSTMYDIAGVEIGAKGWAKIATVKNIESIIENVAVSITDRNETRTIKIDSIL